MSRFLYLLFFQIIFYALHGHSFEEKLEDANINYNKGEQSVIYGEKEKAFNRALKIYAELVDQIDYPSSQLYQAIANTYFQLGETPWAILYYERALKLAPKDLIIQNRLIEARLDLGLEDQMTSLSIKKKLLNLFFSTEKSIELLILFLMLTTLFFTLVIWFQNKISIALSSLFASFSLLLLFNLLLNLYFNPIEGILIQSVAYYREPNEQQPQLTVLPKRAGMKINVLATNPQGTWLKIVDSEGLIGYIPASSIRII